MFQSPALKSPKFAVSWLIVSDPLGAGQTKAFCDSIEFIQGIEFDDYLASMAIFSCFNGDLRSELPAEFALQVKDMGWFGAWRCLELAGAGKIFSD